MGITADIIKEIASKEDDFGHEMRVGAILRSMRHSTVLHGGTYIDSLEEKPRQYDFRFILAREPNLVIQLAVECKNLSPDSPVVVCGHNRLKREATHDIIKSTKTGMSSPPVGGEWDGDWSQTISSGIGNTIYRASKFVGKNVLRLKPDKNGSYTKASDSDVYNRWAQALSSCQELCQNACLNADSFGRSPIYTATLPVVVVPDGSLWRLEYGGSGKIESDPEKVENCEYYVGRRWALHDVPLQEICISHIHFYTLSGLEKFISSLADEFFWDDCFDVIA